MAGTKRQNYEELMGDALKYPEPKSLYRCYTFWSPYTNPRRCIRWMGHDGECLFNHHNPQPAPARAEANQ